MTKFWKITLIICAFLLFGIALHFNLFGRILDKTPFFGNLYRNSVLTINTRRGIATITLNGEDYGQTPQTISNLSEGEYFIELEKISESQEIYPKEGFYIELHRDTEAVLDIEIAPDGFKSGHILYYTPRAKTTKKEGGVSIRSEMKDYEVSIDDNQTKVNEIFTTQLEPKEYDIKIDANGYESLEFPVIVRDGFNLNIRVYLLPIPITF